MVDDAKLHHFMGQMLSDLGGAASIGLVRIGDALGLYKILHARGAMTAGKLAVAAGSTSDTFASGCRIRPLRTISPKIPQRGSLNCRRSKRWFSPSRTAPSICWGRSI